MKKTRVAQRVKPMRVKRAKHVKRLKVKRSPRKVRGRKP